uniref:Somatostatin-like receptor F_48D10.1 n=1 Tax=Sinocyclocheilus rhinocerous TaxID=307959 RepID=A0A673GEE8_9TELE
MESLNQSGWVGTIPGDYNSSSFGLGFSGSPVGNYTGNVSDQSMPFQGSSTMVTAVISFTVFIVGLTGNTLAIYVVLRYSKMKTVTNIYILNLAVADELYILGLPFLTTQNVLSYWPFGSFLCRCILS